jgi:type VI secretion system protein ImpH
VRRAAEAAAIAAQKVAAHPRQVVPSIEKSLFEEGFGFDFFQAVRLLEKLDTSRRPVGLGGPPQAEVVRFRVHQSLSFPPSAIYDIERPSGSLPLPLMTVAFLGLTGPSGALPRHYTELLLRLDREGKGPEKHALRDWLDLFNHRLISLFYRAWEKYRFYIPYERGEYARPDPDAFTRCLFSFVGLGTPSLRGRLRVSARVEADGEEREQQLARLNDLGLLYYSGFLAHRPRCAVALEALLRDYFQLSVQVQQFRGQWLRLDAGNQSCLGEAGTNNEMGINLVAGERVWEVQSKIRVRLGPLHYAQFNEFLPDRSPLPERKAFFLLAHLVRLYVGPELDFDIQLVLQAEDVPECRLEEGSAVGPRLGWNTWIRSQALAQDATDAVFEGEDLAFVNAKRSTLAFSREN